MYKTKAGVMRRLPATSTRSTSLSSNSAKIAQTEPNAQTTFRRKPPSTSASTLTEVLKENPFKPPTNPSSPNTQLLARPVDDPIDSLNKDLQVFADLYRDVKIEVLRELLSRFDGESRLQICVEQLVRYKSEWARGRLLNPPRDPNENIPVEEQFRNKAYIVATRRALCTEFKSLNQSAVDAVLAEVNQSYSKARPLLQGIAAKSWRVAITSFFKRKKALDEPPLFIIEKHGSDAELKHTGNSELDDELEQIFFAGPKLHKRKLQEHADIQLATALNQKEAEESHALYECQVCYNDVAFESIATCTSNAHIICRDCVKRSLNEAVFGQGWAKSVDTSYGTIRCVALEDNGSCNGYISPNLLQTVMLATDSGPETWRKFEQRLAMDNILKSGLMLTQCPFCSYSEASQIYTTVTARSIKWRFRQLQLSISVVMMFLLAELILPSLILIIAVTTLLRPSLPRQYFYTSLINLHQRALTPRFRCKNPVCSRTSCLSCSKPWHDPHSCHEPLILSLRTAVEAARTAALKRTCPRCGTSFVKSSGCNKLTCVCGYAMCYLCRKNIGKVNENGSVDEREGGEGYRHFCEHFRPLPGQRCTQCTKCDLYMNEDEEFLVKKAGEEAEKGWREKEGMVGIKGLGLEEAVGSLGKLGRDAALSNAWDKFATGDWTLQGVCDWVVSKIIIVES